ncbi:D-alanyl-D-alanine carboxypeptidase family protein [Microbacterium hominis]|uniref:D-alanyl-D-alanine carboxypeptidase n=1 Tax=Microbacterium hominis TaxID=162426 RepID=A0A7D4TPW9_9MICO|nr:D-alanyl-D-alanine carboxypeptidase [Microbacterium hominis]QKJ20742.1 D-alanyl-D-alanine carboxypeptidase [Microbacterium hominis]
MTVEEPLAPTTRRAARTGPIPTEPHDSEAGSTITDDTVPIEGVPVDEALAGTGPVDAAPAETLPVEPLEQEHELAETEVLPDGMLPAEASPAPDAPPAHVALAWLDEERVTPRPITQPTFVNQDLLAHRPRRSLIRAGVIVPTALAVLVVAAYTIAMLLWPLNAVEPTVSPITVEPAPAPATALPWPAEGSAAVTVDGIGGVPASSADAAAIASITKVVTALLVLDESPLAVGEAGISFRFSFADNLNYWSYRARGESALDVPVGGELSQYQMLEGMLIGSANNYADRLAGNWWPSDAVFADAAQQWLTSHGVPGVTIVEPTGMDSRNAASPAALITLAQKALENPVIAEIVAKRSVELPGAGLVENTNALLADPGVIGIKTGTLDRWNLLSAKDITVGETPVRLYAAVLGQPDEEARIAASRALYTQLELELQLKPSVPAGTVAGSVETEWGDQVDIVTAADASVILWNGGIGEVVTNFALEDSRTAGNDVGALSVTGPLDATTVSLRLADDIGPPDAWWRLTHPLELLGLD